MSAHKAASLYYHLGMRAAYEGRRKSVVIDLDNAESWFDLAPLVRSAYNREAAKLAEQARKVFAMMEVK
jgi:hypothetical protein